MTNPFQTLVGLKNVSDSGAKILVNDLEGISSQLASAVTSADNTTAQAVWLKIQNNACEKLRSLVETELSKAADFVYTLTQTTVWQPKLTPVSIQTTNLVGCRFQIPYIKYRKFSIEGFFCNLQGISATLPFHVYDLNRGVELYMESINRSTGLIDMTPLVTQSLSYDIPLYGLDLFCGIDPTGVTLTELGGPAQPFQAMQDPVSKTTDPIMTTGVLLPTHYASGFIPADCACWVVGSVNYQLMTVITRFADRLLWAYANVCGSLLMSEKLATPNMNLFTNMNRQFAEDRESKFMDEAVTLIMPVARDMLKALAPTEIVTDRRDSPFDPGYTQSGFV